MSESTWSPSPGAETLGTLQRQIASYVLMPDDSECLETALAGIRRAIDKLNTRNWLWMLTYDDITFVAAQSDYTIDAQLKAPRNFEIWNTSSLSVGRLAYQPWSTFLKDNPVTSSSGTPCYYSTSNVHQFGTITLDVAPSTSWVALYPTGRLWYYRRIQYPVSAGEAIDVPSEAMGYISAFAEGYTADRYAQEKAQAAYARAAGAYKDAVFSDNNVQTDWE